MEIVVIGSGSSGNCVKYGNVIIDMGVTFKALNGHLKGVRVICLTHKHKDHIKETTIKKIVKEYEHIMFVVPSYLVDEVNAFIPKERMLIQKIGKKIQLYGCIIKSVKLHHDVHNVGYTILFEGEDIRLLHATDTAHMGGVEAKGFDIYAIEHNWCQDVVRKLAISGKLKKWENEAINVHLSVQAARKFIEENKKEDSIVIELHCSSERR